MNKKGVSPVIATVLLISVALILALIIFLWARSYISEKTLKSGEPIERACERIAFDAEVYIEGDTKVGVVNRGDVPLYGIELKKESFGSSEKIGDKQNPVANGETWVYVLEGASVSEGDEVIVVPVIVGEAGSVRKAYTCADNYGVKTSVSSS